jgi:hypothetical protein
VQYKSLANLKPRKPTNLDAQIEKLKSMRDMKFGNSSSTPKIIEAAKKFYTDKFVKDQDPKVAKSCRQDNSDLRMDSQVGLVSKII